LTNGTGTFSATLKSAGSQTVSVADTASSSVNGSATVAVQAGAAARLRFTTQPGGGSATVAWAQQPAVTEQDAFGNTVTGASGPVTLAIGSGSPAGATFACNALTQLAVNGIATFGGCTISKAGSGYTLTANAAGLTAATSDAFNIAAGPAAKLIFSTQ